MPLWSPWPGSARGKWGPNPLRLLLLPLNHPGLVCAIMGRWALGRWWSDCECCVSPRSGNWAGVVISQVRKLRHRKGKGWPLHQDPRGMSKAKGQVRQ